MSENNSPPLTPEIREQIAIDQHAVHTQFWAELTPLRVSRLGVLSHFMGDQNTKPVPPLPPQPIRLFGILRRYSVRLFNCEYSRYPVVDELTMVMWRLILQKRIERLVMEQISMIEGQFSSLGVHASHDEMREVILLCLAEHTSRPLSSNVELTLPNTATVESKNDNPTIEGQLKSLFNECRLKPADAAAALKVTLKTIYRHLNGEAKPRIEHIAAYESLFSQRLNKQVRLKTSN